MNLSIQIGSLRLKNPVMTASGTFGYGEEYSEFINLNDLGAVVVKGISLKPMEGNPPPRIFETPCGLLNAIGLQNVGLKTFMDEKLPFLRQYDTKVIVNILGGDINEYVSLAESLDGNVEAVELNVSCPNVKEGGILFGTDPFALAKLVKAVRIKVTESTLIVKLSPHPRISDYAKLCEDEGADALSLINTIPAMSIDIHTRKPQISNVIGGLSGPAIRPIGVKMVWEVARGVKIPVIGMGGIMNSDNAVEYMLAGASAVAVGTANFINPSSTSDVISGIRDYMTAHKIDDISEIIGGISL